MLGTRKVEMGRSQTDEFLVKKRDRCSCCGFLELVIFCPSFGFLLGI